MLSVCSSITLFSFEELSQRDYYLSQSKNCLNVTTIYLNRRIVSTIYLNIWFQNITIQIPFDRESSQ